MSRKLREKYGISGTLVLSIFSHVGLYSLTLILAYNGYKEFLHGLPNDTKHSIKETFPWAILVFSIFYIFQSFRHKEHTFLCAFKDYARVIFFSACVLNIVFISRKEALVVLNASLILSLFLPNLLILFGRWLWQSAPIVQNEVNKLVEWEYLQFSGSRNVFVTSFLLLILLCSYGLPLLGGFTWSTSTCAPAGRIEYQGRHPGMANSLAFDVVTTSRFVEPRNRLLSKYLKEGTLPLWNPYETTGLPFAADFESKAFFPLNILQALMPYRIWDAFYLLRIWLAGFFVYLLLRQYSLAVPVSLFGAAAYMLSGPIALNVTMEEMTNGTFIVPWLIYAVEKLVTKCTLGHVFGLSMPIALITYAGQPKLALLAISCSYIYLLARNIHSNGIFSRDFIAINVKAVLALFVGLLLAAPQVLLSIEYTNRACALPTLFLLSDGIESDSGIFLLMLKNAYRALSMHGGGDHGAGLLLTILPNFWGFMWRPWAVLYQEMGWWTHPAYIGTTASFFVFFALTCYRRYGSLHRFLVLFWSILCFILVSGNYGFKMTTWVQVFAYGGYLRYYAPVFVLSSVIVASLGVELFCNIERDTIRKRLVIAFAVFLGFVAFALILPSFLQGMKVFKYADSTLASYCITKSIFVLTSVVLAIMLLSTRCFGQNLAWCMVLLVFCALALYVPYGFNIEWDTYRLISFAIGFTAMFSVAYNNTRLLTTSILLYIVVMTSLIVLSPRGPFAWHNPFDLTPKNCTTSNLSNSVV